MRSKEAILSNMWALIAELESGTADDLSDILVQQIQTLAWVCEDLPDDMLEKLEVLDICV